MDPITQPPILAKPPAAGLMACVGYQPDHPVLPRTEDNILALADAVGVLVITPSNAALVRRILADWPDQRIEQADPPRNRCTCPECTPKMPPWPVEQAREVTP